MNPELRRWAVSVIKDLANKRIPNYELPADSFIEEAVVKIISVAVAEKAEIEMILEEFHKGVRR